MNDIPKPVQNLASSPLDRIIGKVAAALPNGLVPVEIFRETAVFEAEMQRIFARGWVFLGFEAELPNKGDFMLRKIGTDSVIVTRDGTGKLNVLANFCRHRGTPVCSVDQGHATHFRCPYHGWVYKNTGEWTGAPDKSKAYPDFDKKEWGLLKAPLVESFLGLIFASLDTDVAPLVEHLGGAGWMLKASMDLHAGGMKPMGPPDRYRVRGDWKTGAENFAGDIYHVGVAHRSVETIQFAEGFDTVNLHSMQYIFENGHSFLGHDLDALFGDAGHYWFYDSTIRSQFDLSRVDPIQNDVAKRHPPIVGTVFPNLSFLRYAGPPSPGKPPAVYTSLRQWQPIGPGEMELWSWQLKWDFMDQQQAADSYAAGQFGFSSAGIYEQDDTVVWEGAPQAGKSAWARKEDAMFNIQLGMESLGGVQKEDTDWAGPGRLYRPGPGEPHARNFYRQWLKEMQRGQ